MRNYFSKAKHRIFCLFLAALIFPFGFFLLPFPTVYAEKMSDNLSSLPITATSYLIQSGSRGAVMANEKEEELITTPSIHQIMTCVLALESLTLDTLITISSEAEAFDALRTTERLKIEKGDKYTVGFLISAILYKDSRAAALSLAEYIAGGEEAFSQQMNAFAERINLKNTIIASDYLQQSENQKSTGIPSYTTLLDLGILFRYALSKTTFREIFTSYSFDYFAPDKSYHSLRNTMSGAWVLSYDSAQILGVSNFPFAHGSGTLVALAGNDNFECLILLNNVDNVALYDDLMKTLEGIYSTFEASDLVLSESFYQEVQIEGIAEPIPAFFKSTIRYLHPKKDAYIEEETVFLPAEKLSLPISNGTTIGQVIFRLKDGSEISADVIAKEDIALRSTGFMQIQRLFDANRNVFVIISTCFFLLIFVIIVKITVKISRFSKKSSTKNRNL